MHKTETSTVKKKKKSSFKKPGDWGDKGLGWIGLEWDFSLLPPSRTLKEAVSGRSDGCWILLSGLPDSFLCADSLTGIEGKVVDEASWETYNDNQIKLNW